MCFTFLSINCIIFYFSGNDCALCKFYNEVFKIFSLRRIKKKSTEVVESKKIKLYDNLKLLEFISNYEQYLNTNNLLYTTKLGEKLNSENDKIESKNKYLKKIEGLHNIKYSTQLTILNSAHEIKIHS
jgi:hypothetical protein